MNAMILLKIWTREGAKVNNSSDFFSEEDINVSIIMSIYFKRFFFANKYAWILYITFYYAHESLPIINRF